MVMIRYLHRANDVDSIERARVNGWGIEIDVRTHRGKLYLSHDPILEPTECLTWEFLRELVKKFQIPTILDIKESGIARLIDVRGIESLVHAVDLIFPDQKCLVDGGHALRSLSRSSRYETIDLCGDGCGYWWDYQFDVPESILLFHIPIRTVIVSPELHGQPLTDEFAAWVMRAGFMGVCTDQPERYA